MHYPITPVTNYHKVSSLKILLSSISISLKSKMSVSGLKIKASAGLYFFIEALREDLFPCLFQLLQTAHVLVSWLPSIFKVRNTG